MQLYDHVNFRTHFQPILIAALPDKKTDTYGTFFRNVEEIYKEVTGAEFLMPEKIHADNEAGILNTLKIHFPDSVILTCILSYKKQF